MIELASDNPVLVCDNCDVENLYAEPLYCRGCGASLVSVGDGLPTMGEEYDSELSKWRCTCGKPDAPGVMHRVDAPCYIPEVANDF